MAAPPTHLVAQAAALAHRRFEGFYMRTSIGLSGLGAWGSGQAGSTSIAGDGPSLALALGGSAAPGFAVGATFRLANTTGTFHGSPYAHSSDPYADLFLYELAAFADWYPNADAGWHMGGEAGVGGTTVTPDVTNVTAQSLAFAGAVFGGYDWRIRDSRWAFGVLAVASGVVPAKLEEPHNVDSGYRMQSFAMSIEGTALLF